MRYITKVIKTFIYSFLVLYLGESFIKTTFNAFVWSVDNRAAVIGIAWIVTAIGAVYFAIGSSDKKL